MTEADLAATQQAQAVEQARLQGLASRRGEAHTRRRVRARLLPPRQRATYKEQAAAKEVAWRNIPHMPAQDEPPQRAVHWTCV